MNSTDLSLPDFESYFFTTESMYKLQGLADYLSAMEAQLARLKDEQSAQLKKDLESIPDSWSEIDQYSFVQWREDQYTQFERLFPESFRYSFVVLLWLVIEDELKRVCIEIQRRKGLAPQKWQGNRVVEQCKTILKEISGITDKDIAHWSDICNLQKIRDCVVHTSGLIEESRDRKYLIELVRKVGKEIGLQIEYDRLTVGPQYCKLATQNTIEFFTAIFDGVGIRIWKESGDT